MWIDIRQVFPTQSEAETLASVHAASFAPPGQWAAGSFLATPAHENRVILADAAVQSGVLVLQISADEADVLTIAVLPAARRSGLACALMQHGLAVAKQRGVVRITLEVAVDNPAAVGLYTRLGFIEVGRRKRYYRRAEDDRVDAIVMAMDLG